VPGVDDERPFAHGERNGPYHVSIKESVMSPTRSLAYAAAVSTAAALAAYAVFRLAGAGAATAALYTCAFASSYMRRASAVNSPSTSAEVWSSIDSVATSVPITSPPMRIARASISANSTAPGFTVTE